MGGVRLPIIQIKKMQQNQNISVKTEFNSNLAEIERIHNILCLCDQAQLTNNYKEWYNAILCLKKELRTYMTDTQKTSTQKYVNDLNKAYNESHSQTTPHKSGFQASHKLISTLFEFEEFLRDIRQAKGMGMTEKQDPGEAFLGDN